MSAYMKFFTPSKKSVTDPNGGMINYPEICIDTNPRFEHKLTAHEIIILDQAAELERYETARQEDARRLEQVKGERDEIKRLAKDVNSLLNSTMTWMQEEGIAVPFVMTLMIGSLGEKSEKLAAALKDAK